MAPFRLTVVLWRRWPLARQQPSPQLWDVPLVTSFPVVAREPRTEAARTHRQPRPTEGVTAAAGGLWVHFWDTQK